MAIKKFIKYTLLNSDGKVSNSEFELQLNVSEANGNYLMHRDILRHSIARQQGTVSTKTRSEVRGGGRKPWQQKGTGRARAGSNRSPLWKGGGIIFGPKPKTKVLKINKKERKLTLQTLLYNKKNSIVMVEDLEDQLVNVKTKEFLQVCTHCQLDLSQEILVIVSRKTLALKSSIRNIKNIELIAANNLNTRSLLKANQVFLTLPAMKKIKEIYCE